MGTQPGRRPAIFRLPAQPCGRGRSDRAALNGKKYLKPWLQRRMFRPLQGPRYHLPDCLPSPGISSTKRRFSDLPMHPWDDCSRARASSPGVV